MCSTRSTAPEALFERAVEWKLLAQRSVTLGVLQIATAFLPPSMPQLHRPVLIAQITPNTTPNTTITQPCCPAFATHLSQGAYKNNTATRNSKILKTLSLTNGSLTKNAKTTPFCVGKVLYYFTFYFSYLSNIIVVNH